MCSNAQASLAFWPLSLHFTLLGFEEAHGELENAHRTGRRQDGKPRHIIAKLYARPFKRNLLRAAKNPQNKNLLNGVRLVEDFTPGDFELRKKALPMMKKAFEKGKKVRFTKGKLFIPFMVQVPVSGLLVTVIF